MCIASRAAVAAAAMETKTLTVRAECGAVLRVDAATRVELLPRRVEVPAWLCRPGEQVRLPGDPRVFVVVAPS